MAKKGFVLKLLPVMVGLLFFFTFCTRLKYDIIPDSSAVYHSATIKVNVREKNSRKRQNFKIVLKYDDTRDKMLFLSPLNQVYGLLIIENEKTLLISTKKRKYWRGNFNTLLEKIWALDFNYSQFKKLILNGLIPWEKVKEIGMEISMEKEKESEKPKRIKIYHKDITIKLRISNCRTGKGIINFSPRMDGLEKASIENALEEN